MLLAQLIRFYNVILQEATIVYWGSIEIMEKKMETSGMGAMGITLGIYWSYVGVMENQTGYEMKLRWKLWM